MTTTYERIAVTEARYGDELYQAGEWVRIANVHLFRSNTNVVFLFEGGGSHAMPTSRKPAIRRAVESEATA